jgi:hypothetical protein
MAALARRGEIPCLVKRYAVVSLDEAKRKVDGIEIWPWRAFLGALWRDAMA